MRKILIATAALSLVASAALAGGPGEYETTRAALITRTDDLATNADELDDTERLQRFIDLYFEYTMNEHPEFATYIGLPTGQDRWTDNSLDGEARRDEDTRRAMKLIKTIDREQLDRDDQLDYDLIVDELESGIEGMRFMGELMPITQMNGVHSNVAQMIAAMPARNTTQYENIVARLQAVPVLVENTLERLEKGLVAGVTPPRVTLRDLPAQVRNLVVEDPMTSPLLQPFTDYPDAVPTADRQRLTDAAVNAYADRIRPAFAELADYLETAYLPGARETIGMNALPDGEDWYAYNVAEMTTTDMSPREIHEIGLSEVKRIRREMDRVIEQSGFEGDFEQFTDFLRTDPQFYFTDADELLGAYRDIAKRADAEMLKLFGNLPRTPYGVAPVPEFKAKSSTTAYYEPGSLEAGRPGYFFANTYALDQRPKWEMEALTLHEAVPGHHHQLAIAHELEDLAWFRRFGGETAFVEGWGLYSESLGEEMGFYKDPYSKFGQLTYEIWRAIRLVVDTGMHSLGWTRDEAIEYFKANTGKAEHDIIVEVDRYIVWPGQALAYKIGELKIKELKSFAQSELGKDFDIRAFHDAVLGDGALPLSVLEAHIKEWVSSQKGEAPEVVRGR